MWEVHDLGLEERRGDLQPHIHRAAAAAGRLLGTPPHAVKRRIAAGLVLLRTPAQAAAAGGRDGGRREYQAVLVRGRTSYAFSDFVHGHYPPKGDRRSEAVRGLATHMTVEERLLVATFDFDAMWRHARLGSVARQLVSAYARLQAVQAEQALYLQRRARFYAAWSSERAAQSLRAILRDAAGPGAARWEYPKGKRLSPDETDIDCAVREFWEETRIPPSAYALVPGFCRVECYVHVGVLYVNTYFLAVLRSAAHDEPAATLSLGDYEQAAEVSDVRWCGLETMRRVVGPAGRDLTVLARQAVACLRARGRPPARR